MRAGGRRLSTVVMKGVSRSSTSDGQSEDADDDDGDDDGNGEDGKDGDGKEGDEGGCKASTPSIKGKDVDSEDDGITVHMFADSLSALLS